MATRRLTQADLRSGRALMTATFGAEPRDRLLDDQRDKIADNLAGYERQLPDQVFATIGKLQNKPYSGRPSTLLRQAMTFAGVARFTAAQGKDVDILDELRWLYQTLVAVSPVLSGHYRKSFRFVVGSDLSRAPPTGQFTVAGVCNVSEYAAALENRSQRPFFKTWLKLQRRAKSVGLDIRWSYLPPKVSENGKAPVPVIWIGPLNSMKGRTGLDFTRRRRSRRRR